MLRAGWPMRVEKGGLKASARNMHDSASVSLRVIPRARRRLPAVSSAAQSRSRLSLQFQLVARLRFSRPRSFRPASGFRGAEPRRFTRGERGERSDSTKEFSIPEDRPRRQQGKRHDCYFFPSFIFDDVRRRNSLLSSSLETHESPVYC